MVGFLKRGHSLDKLLRGGGGSSRTLQMSAGRQSHSLDGSLPMGGEDSRSSFRDSHVARSAGPPTGLSSVHLPSSKSRFCKDGNSGDGGNHSKCPSDKELMKEKFAKLLLGEDLSGGRKGVPSALALSNSITNLAASVFGEHRRLEPMPPELKARWKKEIGWLLSVTDHMVEFVPSQQTTKDGTQIEVMKTQQRSDIQMSIPALRKLDDMLLGYLDDFKDQNEFWYVERDLEESEKVNARRNSDKWWIPTVKVPEGGLSEMCLKWLEFQKESVNQVLKAAMAINAQVLSEMEIPEHYLDSLPKNGRASLGDAIYRSITVDSFNPEQFLGSLGLTSEHKILDLKNRIEASVIIWKRKMINKDGKSSWGSAVSLEKREQFEERAETILVLLKQRYPGLPQSTLDISKIHHNKDVGHSVLESYSRVLESLAYNLMSRIEDVFEANAIARNPSIAEFRRHSSLLECELVSGPVKFPSPEEEIEKLNSMEKPTSMTLSDFMGWQLDQGNSGSEVKKGSGNLEELLTEGLKLKKLQTITKKKITYIERLETSGGARSPNAAF